MRIFSLMLREIRQNNYDTGANTFWAPVVKALVIEVFALVVCATLVILGFTFYAVVIFLFYSMFAALLAFRLTGREHLYVEEFRNSSMAEMFLTGIFAGLLLPLLVYLRFSKRS
jgi:formate/nitrite transporter FocA (FNT family)